MIVDGDGAGGEVPVNDALTRRFETFARRECRGSSALYERLSYGIAGDAEVLTLAAHCRPGQPAPNLFFGAVHFLLLGGLEHPLAAFYPSVTGDAGPTSDPYPAFRSFCLEQAASIRALVESRLVQTNEVRRSALLLPALTLVAERSGRPLALVEVGASAGLNLLPDRYGYSYGDGRRAGDPASPVQLACAVRGDRPPPIPARVPAIASRLGIDLNPVDVRDPDAVAWLRALIWPEHAERAALLRRAMAVAAADPPPLLAGDALELLPRVLTQAPGDAALCVIHTHTLNQFPRAARDQLTTLLDGRGTRRDLYRISIGDLFPDPAQPLLGLVAYEDGVKAEQILAACDGHARWIEWRA